MGSSEAFRIESLPEDDPARDEVLGLLLAELGGPQQRAEGPIRRLTEYLERRSLRLTGLWGAYAGQRLVSATMLIVSPGRLGAVHVPPGQPNETRARATVALLDTLQRHAWDASLGMLQTLLTPEQNRWAMVFEQAGFGFLAELCYLDRKADDPTPPVRRPTGLSFVTFGPESRSLFLGVLEATYRDSLDCPRLAGIRRVEDVLATHQATGIFDPQSWQVALIDGRPMGLLLLAAVRDRPLLEVVYMGVAPQARGRGVGDAIMARAVERTRQGDGKSLTLAVDSTNRPARDLYERWSFRELDRRRAWFVGRPGDLPQP
ncbi:MAG: GNAT family N-acetyltransferase [Planctomycetes bacterium]|nr:GNAT family N-acetyltransferase [Planctomycetota bacterium]